MKFKKNLTNEFIPKKFKKIEFTEVKELQKYLL